MFLRADHLINPGGEYVSEPEGSAPNRRRSGTDRREVRCSVQNACARIVCSCDASSCGRPISNSGSGRCHPIPRSPHLLHHPTLPCESLPEPSMIERLCPGIDRQTSFGERERPAHHSRPRFGEGLSGNADLANLVRLPVLHPPIRRSEPAPVSWPHTEPLPADPHEYDSVNTAE